MEYIGFFIGLTIFLFLIIVILSYILYRQHLLLSTYEIFFKLHAEKIKDFMSFLNSILKMNIMYFDDTIFELVEKVKLMKNDLYDLIVNNPILFDEIDMDLEKEKLDQSEEKELLGVVKKYGHSSIK